MEILASFLNGDALTRQISNLMFDIVKYSDDSTRKENEIKRLTEIVNVLPSTIELGPIPNAPILFDDLASRHPTIDHLRLLSSSLDLMTNDERLKRVEFILMKILDKENFFEVRQIFCKLLNKIEISNFSSINVDWNLIETSFSVEQDPKFVVYVCRFLSKNFREKLEEILQRILLNGKYQDETILFFIVDLNCSNLISSSPNFWRLIQRSLANDSSNNDRIRKSAIFLLRKIFIEENSTIIRVENEQNGRILFVSNETTKQFWNDYLIIYEALEDGVVHLIKPLLTKFDRLREFSLENEISLNWLFVLLQRLFLSTSTSLSRWTVRWFLNTMRFPDSQVETFFLEKILEWISNNYVFFKTDDFTDGIATEVYLESFLKRWFESTENPSELFHVLLSRISTIKWSHFSLVRLFHSLRDFSMKIKEKTFLHEEHLKILTSLMLTQFDTYAPVLRLSVYSSIIEFVINLVDWSIGSNSNQLVRFFSFFDRSTFISKHFQTISKHFSLNLRQIQMSIDEFLSSDKSFFSGENRLFSMDNDVFQLRQISFLLDLVDIHNTDSLKTLLTPFLENIRTAYQRPYTSIEQIRRSIELCYGLINENYFHSLNFFKDWLSSSLRLIVREALSFIKLHATKQPIAFSKLPIVFLHVGNHGDISRFLQELIGQLESAGQQQSIENVQTNFLLVAHSIDFLLKDRHVDFHSEWEKKFRLNSIFGKILPIINQPSKIISQSDLLIGKYIFIKEKVLFPGLTEIFIDDLFKASQRELPMIFSALKVVLNQQEIQQEEKEKLIKSSLIVMKQCDHRLSGYWPCLTQFSQSICSTITDVHFAEILTPWLEEMLDRAGQVSGIVNVILESLIPIWMNQHRIQSVHFSILIGSILLGQIHQKDKKQQWQAEQLIEQDDSCRSLIIQTETTPEYRYDRNVRLVSQLFLLHIWPSLLRVQQDALLKEILDRHSQLAFQERRPRFCTNSLEHRLMFRCLQCILCLTSVIKDPSLLKTIYDYVLQSLTSENEPSLRLLSEWIIVRLIFDDRTARLDDLYEHLRNSHRYRIGTICAWISISSHLLHFVFDFTEKIEFINRLFEILPPLLVHSNFHIRTFSCSTMIKILEFIERHELEKQTLFQTYRWLKESDEKSELGKYTTKLRNLFLYQFDPIRDFSLETIFYTLPKLSLITEDEFLPAEWSIELNRKFHFSFPIPVHNVSTLLNSCQPGIWKLTAAGKNEISSIQDEENSLTVQHKANPYPTMEPIDDSQIRKNLQRTQLILVASLIDKQTNLGGLCRTAEVFGVKEMVITSLKILDDQQFQNLSMTAHKWLNIKQVQEKELKDYLIDMQAQGYLIVAVEQTVNSQTLYEYKFPEKTLLLLGNEREGIRADLLSLVDATVEIPQAGVIRSLNVHVSGALCISEYARKYLKFNK